MPKQSQNQHAIQLEDLRVTEFSYKRHRRPGTTDQLTTTVATGKAKFHERTKSIACAVKAECFSGTEEDKDFELRVEIMGIFSVDVDRFPIENLEKWQEQNAPYLLMPYLREQVYGLSMRAGINPPIILQLLTVPTTRSTLQRAAQPSAEEAKA